MQITAVNNAIASPKGSGSFSEDPAGAGGFDMAMAALLALLNPQPAGAGQTSSGSSGDNNASIAGTGSSGLVDLPGDMLIMNPAPLQQEPQSVAGTVTDAASGEAGQIAMPAALPDTAQAISEPVLPGGDNAGNLIAGTGSSGLVDLPGDMLIMNPAPLQQESQSVAGTVTDAASGEAGQIAMPAAPPDTAQAVSEPVLPGGQTSQAALSSDTGTAPAAAPVLGAQPDPGTILEGTGVYAASQVAAAAQGLNDAVAADITVKVSIAEGAKGLSPANETSAAAPAAIPAAGSTADPPPAAEVKSAAQDRQPNTVSFVPASEVDGVAKQAIPAYEKNPANGLIAAQEPQLIFEKKVVAVDPENAVIKPGVENQQGVVVAEQQRNPEFTGQDGSENNLPDSRPKAAQTAKVDSGNGLAANNTTDVSAQFPAPAATDSPKGVNLPGLKDRVLQEIRHSYSNIGDHNTRQTRVQLKLEPEHLGQLTIKLYFHNGELNAHFYTANNSVKEVLEGSLQQLRDSLGQQDLKLNEAFVFVGNGNQNQDQANLYYEGSNRNGAALYGDNYYGKAGGDIPAEPSETVKDGTKPWQVNYLV